MLFAVTKTADENKPLSGVDQERTGRATEPGCSKDQNAALKKLSPWHRPHILHIRSSFQVATSS